MKFGGGGGGGGNNNSRRSRFLQRFPDEDASRKFVEEWIWKNGEPVCPFCGSQRYADWGPRPAHYRCKDCRKIYSVRKGTAFEGSRISYQQWLYAIYLLQTAHARVSSPWLAKQLGITQTSAWLMLRRLQEKCDIDTCPVCHAVDGDASP